VTITGPASGALFATGTPVNFTGSFTDNAGDTHTAQWSFGATTAPGSVTEATGAVTKSYTFSTPGVYYVKLKVTDQAGGSGTATTVNGLDAMVVIYDPKEGYVTGGGWINSPAGAYPANPALTGKASFGFVSKYQRGLAVPSGSTEFQFQAGKLNFHSTSNDWLVISGAKAQYKGSGTIGGAGDYGFLISVVDGAMNGGGGTDKFRIKITDKTSGGVVYDNQLGASDTTSASTVIAGGSIVIHFSSKSRLVDQSPVEPVGAGSQVSQVIPIEYALSQNTPNPFRGRTEIRFGLPERSQVRLSIYDIAGREVVSLAAGDWDAGFHAVSWSGRGEGGEVARAGVYFVRIAARSLDSGRQFTSQRKMILME